jgi:hypothetical protein
VTPLPRRQRVLLGLWVVLAVALWNAIFEMMVVRGVKEYLFRAALHEAGRRPFTAIADVMDPAIYNATWVATLWTSLILLVALITIRAGQGARDRSNHASADTRLEPADRLVSAPGAAER